MLIGRGKQPGLGLHDTEGRESLGEQGRKAGRGWEWGGQSPGGTQGTHLPPLPCPGVCRVPCGAVPPHVRSHLVFPVMFL